ncbi:hemerythrin-like metal-binding protein [Alkaliphilus metalliredigens QYMF]|uniref:Hemerythrin-like metal-binding protein n=1 Tax=Alkaliphilus metalliredigens (strain QYMF) TaxID=293826 RepID=A6TX13_ALKMQ|nr:bacteriohemerythrin [Alkaliphilus metalliredigens]ABR50731.1 hemerythrin-like metal-binding protein [Alkaliphilus metalliredigens QYMF]
MFKWKESFNCEVGSVDQQHQKLFQIGMQLHEIVKAKDQLDHYDEMMEVLQELKHYTIDHFQYEEALMEKHHYPGIADHKEAHQAFINKVIEIENQDIDEKQKKIGMDIIIFIANWIESHIMKVDMEYKEFFQEKGSL